MIQWRKIISFDFHHIPKLSIGFNDKLYVTGPSHYLLLHSYYHKIQRRVGWHGGGEGVMSQGYQLYLVFSSFVVLLRKGWWERCVWGTLAWHAGCVSMKLQSAMTWANQWGVEGRYSNYQYFMFSETGSASNSSLD